MLDKLYSIFLCLAREDGTGDRHKRAAIFLEMISTFFLSFLTMLTLGLLNQKLTNFMLWILMIAIYSIGSYFLFNSYFIKSKRYMQIMDFTNQYEKNKKVAYAILAAFLVLFSAGLLIGGGIIMSYLYGL